MDEPTVKKGTRKYYSVDNDGWVRMNSDGMYEGHGGVWTPDIQRARIYRDLPTNWEVGTMVFIHNRISTMTEVRMVLSKG